jgi:phenylacetate-CoA ligase
MSDFFDELETRAPEERQSDLLERLPGQIAHARENTSGFGELFKDIDPTTITSLEALSQLPITRKPDLVAKQADNPPFGGFSAKAAGDMPRLFMSPGPIMDPSGDADWWNSARAGYAAGLRAGDIVMNCFSYHFTPAAFLFEGGARQIGCAVIPAGVGNTDMQITAASGYKANAYVGTPDFLKIILEKADEQGTDLNHIKTAMVSAGPLFPALRQWYMDRGLSCLQCYGTADLGIVAYESMVNEGMILNEDYIVQICGPDGKQVEDGEIGEVVVTTFNKDYPLVRFGTGDLSAVLPGQSPCGRTNTRIKGSLGRADMITKVRGMFVHPSQVERTVASCPEIQKFSLVITEEMGSDIVTLYCTVDGESSGDFFKRAETALADICKVRGSVVVVDDIKGGAKTIDDERVIG